MNDGLDFQQCDMFAMATSTSIAGGLSSKISPVLYCLSRVFFFAYYPGFKETCNQI